MEEKLLHVVSMTLHTPADADQALRHLRRLCPSGGEPPGVLLLFCDLGAADAVHLPQDAPMIRTLQSGIMAMNARRPGTFLLLVRRRVWDDAARQYLGAGQALSCREAVAQLIAQGKADAAFEAATFTPGSLMGRFSFVLFSCVGLSCTPDTPARMLKSAKERGIVLASVRLPASYPETVFARLVRKSGFSLSPLAAARETALGRQGLCPADRPAMYTAAALSDSLLHPCTCAPIAPGCFFVRLGIVSMTELFTGWRLRCLRRTDVPAYLPLIQLAAFFLAAGTGWAGLAALALLPELWTLAHPRQLPGALLRTALLPLTALVSLDALLCRLLARSPLVRLRLPDMLVSAHGSMLLGGALLPLAISSAQALVPLLPIALSWLCAPLLLPALDSATIERIPLQSDQLSQLRTLAENAYYSAAQDARAHPALRMLTACAGCMLGLLEPDEAARQVQALLDSKPQAAAPETQAAMLVCAQYLRERMADCDAALRALPAQLESLARSKSALPLLFAADTLSHPLCMLFLPLGPAKAMTRHNATLPLTHPHTFLKRIGLSQGLDPQSGDPVHSFLGLAAGALGHPFYALLMRSPVAAPYAAAWEWEIIRKKRPRTPVRDAIP